MDAAPVTLQQHASARFSGALLCSLALHASLMYGISVRAPSDGGVGRSVIHAHLISHADPTQSKAEAPAGVLSRDATEAADAAGDGIPDTTVPGKEQAGATDALPVPADSGKERDVRSSRVSLSNAPPMEVPVLIDPTYYPTRELDVFPKPIQAVNPPFPGRAATDQVSGSVTLELLIDERGVVQDIKVLEAAPVGYFEEAAVASFRAARFTPASKDGRNVRSRLAISVDFALDPEALGQITRAIR